MLDEHVRGADKQLRLAPTAHWLTTAQALCVLFVANRSALSRPDIKRAVRHRSRSEDGEPSCSSGNLWFKPDLLALVHVRRETGSDLLQAARTLLAYRENRLVPKP